MQPLLLLIGLTIAAAVALLVVQVYSGATTRERVVRARVGTSRDGLSFAPSSVMRAQERSRVPFAGMLPVSREASERTSRELEQAGSSLRVGEYLAIRLMVAVVGGALAALLLNRFGVEFAPLRFLGIFLVAVLGWMLPRISLSRKRTKRLRRIEE